MALRAEPVNMGVRVVGKHLEEMEVGGLFCNRQINDGCIGSDQYLNFVFFCASRAFLDILLNNNGNADKHYDA